MRFLLDTNIVIPAEPTSPGEFEARTPAAVAFLKVVSHGGHTAFVHPASAEELRGDRDTARAAARAVLLRKYPELERAPPMSTRLLAALGPPRPGSNSEVDLLLLSALDADAVDYFVTEDDGIHRRAQRVELSERVLTLADATATVQALFPTVPDAPPFVSAKLAYELDERDPIFDSFRADYPTFDDWLSKCKREHRKAWVIKTGPSYGGVCIVNDESPLEYGVTGKMLKICSFKIADEYRGQRFGELLLKALFGYLFDNRYEAAFVEVYAKHNQLVALFGDFGFEDLNESSKGERVLLKRFRPSGHEKAQSGPLDYNVKYGPHGVSLAGARVFVVPIRPEYHSMLFPDLEEQMVFPTESRAFGNGICKAYLCHSQIRKIVAGDLVLFYRSRSDQAVTAVGVAEQTLVSSDAAELARFVGKRTVYSYDEITKMAEKPVLALLFRF